MAKPLKHPEGCEGCHNLPGVLVLVNGSEIQRCDECAPGWDDADAVNAIRAAFPWLPVIFDPDRDDDGNVINLTIGAYAVDFDVLVIPKDAPRWLAKPLRRAKRLPREGHAS